MEKSELNQQRYLQAFKLIIRHYLRIAKVKLIARIFGLMLPSVGSVFVFYLPPLYLAKIIANIQNSGEILSNDNLFIVILFGLTWLAGEMMWRLGIFFLIKSDSAAIQKLYNDGLRQILRHDLSFFHDNFAGSLTKKTLAYANRFIDVADTIVFNVLSSLIPVLFALVILTIYSPFLSLCLFGFLVLTISLAVPKIKNRRKMVTERETAQNVISGHVADIYGNIDAVRAHSSEERELSHHQKYVERYIHKLVKSWTYQNSVVDMIISPLYVLTNVSGLILALFLANRGDIAPEAIIVVFAYYGGVTRFMWEFNGIYRKLESALSDAAQYTELLLTEPKILDQPKPKKLSNITGTINFENVTFAYGKKSNLFKDFNFTIKAGQKVGLVGRSGGGKTSITKLLLRFRDVSSGEIKIDGVNIANITQKNLHDLIAYVPQEPIMFHRSIADNIAYGKPDATEAEIKIAAQKAHADGFISNLANGYETLVGERGVKLSGGQRQRIAIARAFLKASPIILLDEATSALDSESEVLIQDALKELMKGRTAIVIAHRLSTIQRMDRIVVLDKGEILEEGTHAELIKNKGTYATLWAHQSGGFIED